MQPNTAPIGGAFLIEDALLEETLTTEELPSEARLMAKTVEDFIRKEVLPLASRTEAHEEGLMKSLVKKAAALGLLSTSIPEKYDGLDLPKSHITLLVEKLSLDASFSVSIGAHTSIGTLPVLYFGTPEQRQKYVPKLASGELIGAFCLSEANSGSDALAAQTKATLSPDGKHYLLNGTKMWTTNGGFADLYTVFAKVDGEHFTAFLVERNFPGVSVGKEEHKLGIKGSSTCRIILDNAEVSVENVLGEIGKGHRPALYSLNIGRFSIGVGGLGHSKEVIKISAKYAKQRVQFGKPIAEFGLMKHKFGEMALQCFVLESMVYRIAGWFDVRFGGIDIDDEGAADKYRAASEEYSIECAIMKFFGSEVLDFVVDEGLQIHGGFGYTEEFPMARAYRDARINRIFEGTNEINRLTVLDQAFRRALKGRLALTQAAANLKDTILSASPSLPDMNLDPIAEIGGWVRQIRNATLYAAGQSYEALGQNLIEKQEVVAAIADMAASLFALESAWLRLQKLKTAGSSRSELAVAAVQVFGADVSAKVEQWARVVLCAISEGDARRVHISFLRRLLKIPLIDTVTLRRKIAAAVLDSEAYPW